MCAGLVHRGMGQELPDRRRPAAPFWLGVVTTAHAEQIADLHGSEVIGNVDRCVDGKEIQRGIVQA